METKKKTFDAVEESRKWRESTSSKLDAMLPEQRITYLRQVGERYIAERAARRSRRKLTTASSS
jgi:hypothetical protein